MMVERNRPWLEKSNPRQKNSNVQSSLVLASPPPSYHWKDKISKMNEVVFLSRCWCTFRERIHIFNLRAWSLSPKIKTITLFIACLYKTYHYLVCRSQQMYTSHKCTLYSTSTGHEHHGFLFWEKLSLFSW